MVSIVPDSTLYISPETLKVSKPNKRKVHDVYKYLESKEEYSNIYSLFSNNLLKELDPNETYTLFIPENDSLTKEKFSKYLNSESHLNQILSSYIIKYKIPESLFTKISSYYTLNEFNRMYLFGSYMSFDIFHKHNAKIIKTEISENFIIHTVDDVIIPHLI